MSIQSIYNSSSNYDVNYAGASSSSSSSKMDQMKKAFDSLSSALGSGDLKAAQAAFATIQANAPKQPPAGSTSANGSSSSTSTSASGSTGSTSGPSADFQALAKALASGDIKAAQSAFATLQKDRPSGPPPDQSGSGSSTGASGNINGLNITA